MERIMEPEEGFTCARCKGECEVEDLHPVEMAGATFSNILLSLLHDTLPGVQLEIMDDPLKVCRFRFTGGLGYLMPMRASR